jgi:hypothetical protein
MKTYPKIHEPFAFWLTRQFLPKARYRKDNFRPINNYEFYSIMGIIVAALFVLDVIFHGLPF